MKGTYQSDNDFLLSAVQRGDQKAFDTLFRRYYPMLCAYGHRFVELEDAEEIVEDSLYGFGKIGKHWLLSPLLILIFLRWCIAGL